MKLSTTLRSLPPLLGLLLLTSLAAVAQPGTVRKVQTFTFGSATEGYFIFPPDSVRFEKILMHYKLRCPLDGPCGEWDYLMYINLFDHTGIIDSARDTSNSFTVHGSAPDSISFMKTQSWLYQPHIRSRIVYTDTTSLVTATIGTGTQSSSYPFNGGSIPTRSQFLWRKAELTATSLVAGNITGIRFNLQSGGRALRNLTIKLKSSTYDSLGTPPYEGADSTFTTVYSNDIRFSDTGWVSIPFTTPFAWDGKSNIVVDIGYDSASFGTGGLGDVRATATAFPSGVVTSGSNHSLHFDTGDYIEVPPGAFSGTDSLITIAFWAYGDPARQPQQQSIFEGLDASGRRVLNMHAPWSDAQVYWDAGNSGGYDRVIKAAKPGEYEGRWNYWVVTKNVKTKVMRIYLNGVSWASGSSKSKPITDLARLRLGAMGDGNWSYGGNIDEFAVFNDELDAATIKAWMNRPINSSHPFWSKLKLYYRFEDGSLRNAIDSSGHHFDGALVGIPGAERTPGADLFLGLAAVNLRPNVVFEQGVFTSHIDSTVAVDTIPATPIQIVLYKDVTRPGVPTDTLTVWPSYAHDYHFDAHGKVLDSTLVKPDSTLHLVKIPYFRKYEVVNKYELGRYITPYGNGLSLGNGFDWVYDVSDYRTLLHDTVHLQAFNQQELVDLSFEFFEGTPPRDPLKIENVWNGLPAYGTSTPIENFLVPKKVYIPTAAANTRLKMRTTGHGFGDVENCSEFCPKTHTIKVNGVDRFDTVLFRYDCGLNPVYPQGGTWVYNRSNWCPGADVRTYDLELTPFVTPGDSATLDYDIEPYTWNGQGTQPYYDIETQVVTYSAPNFTLDAALDQIKTPSNTDMFKRMNPICTDPIVTIKNTGSTPLTTLTITYGAPGGQQYTHQWTGNLKFLESTDVHLGAIDLSGATTFQATVSAPNGGADQYTLNNTKQSTFTAPPVYPSGLIFELKTNNNPEENSYEIRDAGGNVVHSRGTSLDAATTYSDTLNLAPGCYEFRLTDLGGDGLSWWANTAAGAGSMRIRKASTNSILVTFNADFGSEIYQQFTVAAPAEVKEVPGVSEDAMTVSPNPTSGEIRLDLSLRRRQDVVVVVRDLLGAKVFQKEYKDIGSDAISFDLSGQPSGVYVVSVQTATGTLNQKVVVR